jgi:hypothetical protein
MENIIKEKGENIKCFVRCRPLNDYEKCKLIINKLKDKPKLK